MTDLILAIIFFSIINFIAFKLAKIKYRSHINRFMFYKIPDFLRIRFTLSSEYQLSLALNSFSILLISCIFSNIFVDFFSFKNYKLGSIIVIIIFFLISFYNYYILLRTENIKQIVLKSREDLLDGIFYFDLTSRSINFMDAFSHYSKPFIDYAQAHQYVIMWHELSPIGLGNVRVINEKVSVDSLYGKFSFPSISKAYLFKIMLESNRGSEIIIETSKDFPPEVLQYYNKELDLLKKVKNK